MNLTVGRLAKLAGVSVRTLHHYDEIGLLVPSQRSESGYRLYSQNDVQRLYRIQALRQLGWSLAQVQAAIDGGGAAIAGVLSEQLATLDAEIARASALRSKLAQLRERLSQRGELTAAEWQAAVEMFSHYDKHLSPDELSRLSLVPEGDKDEWRTAYAVAASAQARGVAPETDEAQAIGRRWLALTWRQVGGDLQMALKLKSAYKDDAAVRASMAAVAGVDPAVMQFIWAAMHHGHLAHFAKHFSREEIARLQFSDAWTQERSRLVAAFAHAMAQRADTARIRALVDAWDAHLNRFVADDPRLLEKLLQALDTDASLRKLWLLRDDVHAFIRAARRPMSASQ